MNYNHLPHKDVKGYYQFVTFRTHDSTDIFLKRIEKQKLENRIRQMKIDEYLDKSNEGAYLNGKALVYRYIMNNPLKLRVGFHGEEGVHNRLYGIYGLSRWQG